MATRSLRIDENLVLQARRHAKVERRSINCQVEYWALLGKAVAAEISMADALAVTQGLKEIRVEPVRGGAVEPETVLKELEGDRAGGFSGKPVTAAPFYFEASADRPGFLDRVDRVSGERQTGRFENGIFETI